MATDALFASWFDLADVDRDGALSGQEAVQFLLRSGLPQQTLKRIWELSDSGQTGQLDRPSFKVAMQLVSLAQAGAMLRDDHPSKLRSGGLPAPPPPALQGLPPAAPPPGQAPGGQYGTPPALQQQYGAPQSMGPPVPMHSAPPAYGGPPPPQPPPPGHVSWPPLTPDDARRHAASFRVWDADGDGKVTGSEAKPLFAQSGVATVQWFKLIWDLADGDVDGSLTLPEFVVASYFLEQAAKGHPPPAAIPPGIFPPPHALMAAAGAGGPGMQAPPPGLGLGQMQVPPPEQAPRAPPVAPNSNIPAVPALPEHLFGVAPASDAAAARTAHGEATKAQAALVAADAQRVSSATAAAELTATVRELTLLKRRCEAELSEAEFAAERAARQLAEARTAHDSQRAATEAVQARLQAAHTARQQAEAEIAELQAQHPGGADVQAAVQLAESQQLAAQQALAQLRDAVAAVERASAARAEAERQLAEAQAGAADKGHTLAQEEARLREVQQQLYMLRSTGPADGGQAQHLGDVAQRAAQLAGEALALARAQGVAVTLPPQLLAALPPGTGTGAPQAAVFTEDWREWEDFPDAGWVPIGPQAHAGPPPQAQATQHYVQAPAVPPALPPQRASFERPAVPQPPPPPLQPPPPKPSDLMFGGGLGSPNGAFGASAPPAMAPPPPPPRPLDDDFFGSGFGTTSTAPPPPLPPAREQDLWSSFM